MSTESPRISDSERDAIVEELGQHVGAGRLSIDEFDIRTARVYRADTIAEAKAALADLPVSTQRSHSPTPRARRRLPLHQRIEWTVWFGVGALNVLIWGVVSLTTSSVIYPWPVWVIGPWGLVLLTRTLLRIEGGSHAPRSPANEAARAAARAHREHARAMALAHRRDVRALTHTCSISGAYGTCGSPSSRSTRG